MTEAQTQTDSSCWAMPRPMTAEDFNAIGSFIQSQFGIKMPPAKKVMLQSRLTKRLRAMNMSCYSQYREYLFSEEGQDREVPCMIDVVTTNKTDFFRESSHFDLLQEVLLPLWMRQTGGRDTFNIWSAGCATGEEPYTMAMVLSEFAEAEPDFRFSILGTDISGEALQKAVQAVYREPRADGIPSELKKKYLMRSKDRKQELIRIEPTVRSKVTFQRLNLMGDFTSIVEEKEVIFCRNVIIYFDRSTQEALFEKCCQCLKPGGYLFIGHSETLSGMRLPLTQVQPTVYQKI